MKTVAFRGGCLTGTNHSGVEAHGFLSYFFRAAFSGKKYIIYGYKGKQVRDQIHSKDVLAAFEAFYDNPSSGEVYNLGGGKANSISVLETIDKVESIIRRKIDYEIVDQNRNGDHICYYSDLSKFKDHYPDWKIFRNENCCISRRMSDGNESFGS